MRALSLLMALSALTVVAVPLAGAAQCIPCEPVNNVCKKVLKVDCLASASEPTPAPAAASSAEPAQCSGGICDTINRLCGNCIPEAEAQDGRCMGAACDAINRVCDRAFGVSCVG